MTIKRLTIALLSAGFFLNFSTSYAKDLLCDGYQRAGEQSLNIENLKKDYDFSDCVQDDKMIKCKSNKPPNLVTCFPCQEQTMTWTTSDNGASYYCSSE